MSPSPTNRAFQKIKEINRELDRSSLERIQKNRKQRQTIYSLVILLVVLGIALFAVFFRTGILKYLSEDIHYEISLLSATANDEGNVKIVLTLFFSDQAKFSNVQARLTDAIGKQKCDADVMPVYLEKNRIDLYIINPDIVSLPGQCDIKVTLHGSNQTSNSLRILQLERMGGEK